MITTTRIDELGALLAQIKTLTAKAEAIKADIKEEASMTGQKLWAGDVFDASYSESNVSTVNWKALAKELAIPAELIAKHTSTSARYTVKCEEK